MIKDSILGGSSLWVLCVGWGWVRVIGHFSETEGDRESKATDANTGVDRKENEDCSFEE